ncbi:Biotin-protein ligase / Biotin operon repressor [Methylophaga frappieri]|uniref:Biotin-protein ligase / Biotin operon repressor n=1 Tax=Methylophaga frappieri (strain ATCC BAA-2434 / DSM 25690 / JAM7) TaxID=754477 RepID=I1YFU7_METFJ|nr:biotin--[acetyl-CoA-carboxylase] ligase [Methylophaga frappieri]AFJ01790.1 Biotin-protein ligase / Biotin operon repressor [Methylophaga frappieri]
MNIAAFDAAAIRAQLEPNHAATLADILIYDSVTSTNDVLWQRFADNPASPAVCIAEQQSAGRGRRGGAWQSPAGGNIYLSLFWPLPTSGNVEGLSIAVGISLIHALSAFGVNALKLKWPNDILHQRRKLAGILVEARYGESYGVVIGIGINYIALPAQHLNEIPQPVTNLAEICPQIPDRNSLCGQLINHIMSALKLFQHQGLTEFLPHWPALDALHEQSIVIKTEQGSLQATACGINEKGELRYMHNQQLDTLSSSHVSIRFAS